MRSLACLFVVAVSTSAFAQAPGETAQLPPPTSAELKDPDTAMLISVAVPTAGLITTILAGKYNSGPAGLIGFGAIYLGPSMGRWYAGDSGLGSLALRTAAGVSTVVGLGLILSEVDCEGSCSDHSGAGGLLLFGGLGVWVGTSIYDVVMAKRAAEDWNAHHQPAMQLQPMMTSVEGHHVMGLALAGHF